MNSIKNIYTQPKIRFILIFFLGAIFSVQAQYDVQLNTYWQNPYYITPAYVDINQDAMLTMAYRKQWLGFQGAPATLFAAGTSYIPKLNSQFGLRIFYDKFGYTSIMDLALTYAYNLQISETWQANFGLSGSLQTLNYDLSRISTENMDNVDIYSKLEPKKGFNSDVGFEVYNSSFRFGVASRNVISLFKADSTDYNMGINYLYGIYRKHNDNPVEFGYGVFGIQYGNRVQLELNVTSYFKLSQGKLLQNYDVFQIGAFYRTNKEIGAIFGINLSEWLYLSYCYDYNFGFGTHRLGQTHEIMLSYKLNPKPLRWNTEK